MTRAKTTRREVVRRLGREELGGLALVAIGLAGGALGLAGQLTALMTDYGWPSWRGAGMTPVFNAVAHPTEPMSHWPGIGDGPPPPALLYWAVVGALMCVVAAAVIALLRLRPRSAPGFAHRRDVARRLGKTALIRQAPRLRPNLTQTPTQAHAPTQQLPRRSARRRATVLQVGTWRGRDVHTGVDCYSSIRQSTFVVGPSESGKTACVVIPEILDHDGPLLAVSSRADVMAATWQPRADRGRVLLFDPLRQASALPLVRWDPVRDCTDPIVAMRRAQSHMSSVDMSGVENGGAWLSRGQAILRNLLHAAAVSGGNIRTVLRWTFDQTAVEPAAILQRSALAPDSWADLQYQVIQTPDRQRAGYYMPVENAVDCFMHPAVLDTCTPTAAEHFDTMSFFFDSAGQSTMYLLAQRDQAVGVLDLLAALMDDIIHHARDLGQFSEHNRLDPPLRLVVDEAPSTATLTQLPSLIADGGGRGIPTTMIVQDRAQAIDRWGVHAAQSMWGAATLRMVLPGVAAHDELREIASYVDEYDEEIPSFTRHAGAGTSEQLSLRTRPGMTPADVRALPAFHSLLIASGGLRPVLTELTPYWKRPDHAATAAAERRFYDALNDGRSLT